MQIPRAGFGAFLGAQRESSGALAKILHKFATAQRINRASDDAAGLSISEELRSQVRGFQTANTNVDYAQASQFIAEATGNQATSILQRQRELAVQASNGTLNQDQRNALNEEYQQLNDELTRISDSATFNGQNVANGTELGAGGGEVLASANPGSELDIEGADFTAAGLGTAASDISSPANASAAIDSLDAALAQASQTRTNIGANINRLDVAKQTNENLAIRTQEAEARVRDLDFTEGLIEKTRQELLNQSSLGALSNFNEINRTNMNFLLG